MHRFLLLSLPVLLAVSEAQAIIRVEGVRQTTTRCLANRTVKQLPLPVETHSVAEKKAYFEELARVHAHNQALQEKPKHCEFEEVIRKKVVVWDKHITDAFCAASVAYNNIQDVAPFSWPLRGQVQNEERLAWEAKHPVVDFHAAIPGYGDVRAGVACYSTDVYGRGRITVAYHGTECIADLFTDLFSLKTSAEPIGLEGFAHGGFLTRYMQSRAQMRAVVEKLLEQHGQRAQDVEILVSGHSLGGALATLAAVDLKKGLASKSELVLVTDGCPRVFDPKAAEGAEKTLQDCAVRIWREGDLIAAISFGTQMLWGWFTGFKHVGKSVKLPSIPDKGLMSQHSHEGYKRAALSDEVYTPLPHQGMWDWAHSWFGSWFGSWFDSTSQPQISNEAVHDATTLEREVMPLKPDIILPALSAQDTLIVQNAKSAQSGAEFEMVVDEEVQTPVDSKPATVPVSAGWSPVRSLSNWWYGSPTEPAPAV